MVGGIGELKAIDQHLIDLLGRVEEEVKLKIAQARNGNVPEKLEPTAYKTQLVAGTNFFVKVRNQYGMESFINLTMS
jgi:hypothetical protein